ncbi:hypothetical protein Pfo_017869 [Paulownia fortunei]|nr:hypothetical protein Pfo_017869 [Paulownia fortunei]
MGDLHLQPHLSTINSNIKAQSGFFFETTSAVRSKSTVKRPASTKVNWYTRDTHSLSPPLCHRPPLSVTSPVLLKTPSYQPFQANQAQTLEFKFAQFIIDSEEFFLLFSYSAWITDLAYEAVKKM